MAQKDLKVRLIAEKGSGTDAAFRQIEKGLASLARHAQQSAVSLSKLGMKEASVAMAHMSTAVNQGVKAFADGGKNIAKFAKAVDGSGEATSRYNRELAKTGITIGDHAKAIRKLGTAYGTSDDHVKHYGKTLAKVEQAGAALSQKFTSQLVLYGKVNKQVRVMAKEFDTAAISQQVLRGNLIVTNGKFQILNKQGLTAFKKLSEDSARSLGMLSKQFGTLDSKLASQTAWKKAKANFIGSSEAIKRLNTRIKENPAYVAKATKILERYTAKLKVAEKETSKFSNGLDFLKGKFRSFLGYTVAASVTAATLGTALKLISQNIEYSQALEDLAAITSATTQEMALLDEKIREVAGSTKFSATEIAEGMKLLGQSGFSATESISAIEGVANLATGTLSSMSTSVELVTTAIRVFRKDASETATVADIFTNAVNNSKLTIDKIKTSLNYLGPIAENANISLEETTATLMVLANAGVRASSSSTGFRRVIKELVQPSEKMKKAIHSAGYALSDFDLQSQSMSDIVSRLGNLIDGAGDSIELFGLRGSTVAAALVTQGAPAFEKMLKATQRQGTAAKNAAIQVEGLGIKFKQIGDKAANLALAIGDAGLNSALHVFADVVRAAIDGLTSFISVPAVKYVVGLTAAITALMALQIATTMVSATSAFGAFSSAIKLATAKTLGLNAAMLSNPIVLVTTAIAALGYALYKYNNSAEEVIATQQKLYDESTKNVTSLDAEINSVINFNGVVSEKLKKLDQLAKAYPAYAAEIYNTKGEADDLVKVLKEIQELEQLKALNAAQDSIDGYSDKIEKAIISLEHAETAVSNFHNVASNTEDIATANARLREYHQVVQEAVDKVVLLQEAGRDVTVEDLFPKNAAGQVEKRYQFYADAIKKALNARRDLTNEEKKATEVQDNTSSKIVALNEEIAAQKTKLALAKELAESEAVKAKQSTDTLNKLNLQVTTEGELLKATNASSVAAKKKLDADKEVNRITNSILIKSGELHELMKKDTKLALQQAKFYGDTKAIAIAKENDEFQKQLILLGELSEKRLESGMSAVANQIEYSRQIEIAQKKHNERVLQINFEASLKELDLKKRTEEAKKDYVFKSAEDVEKVQLTLLENKKVRIQRELQFNQERLGVLAQNETANKDLIIALNSEIEKKKQSIFKIEADLINRRTQIIKDSYDIELSKIDEVSQRKLSELQKSYEFGIFNKTIYEMKKSDIEEQASQARLLAAQENLAKLQKLENASSKALIVAKRAVADAQQAINDETHAQLLTYYNEEVARTTRLREIQRAHAQERLAEIEEEKRRREEADRQRIEGAHGVINAILGWYSEAATAMENIGTKAAGILQNTNAAMGTMAGGARNVSSEFSMWEQRLAAAKKQADVFTSSMLHAMPGWLGVYKEVANKWKTVVAATKEKLQYIKDISKIQNTEVTTQTDLVALQNKLNNLREHYKYLGEADLKNLFAAKQALQEQINAQRRLSAEKDNEELKSIAKKLEAAKAAGVDIQEFGFDPKSVNRLQEIEKENKKIDAAAAAQAYADAQRLEQLKKASADEEALAEFRQESEKRIADIRNPQQLMDLESSAIRSRLDLEQLNLETINQLKIKQYEKELARQEALHQEKLLQIDEENARRLAGIRASESAIFERLEGLDPTRFKNREVRKAAGGRIPGNSTIDSVRVLARPGEWFIRNESADHWSQKFGDGFMDGINKPFSATGQAIASALKGASVPAMPEVVQAPKAAFSTGGRVSKLKEDNGLAEVLSKLSNALKTVSSQTSDGDSAPSKQITVNLQSGSDSVQGVFAESDASKLMKILQNNQMVTG